MTTSPLEYFDQHQHQQRQFLKNLVLQNSCTAAKPGIDRVGNLIEQELKDCNMIFFRHQQTSAGDNLVFKSPPAAAGEKALLLVGHMDTIFPPDSHFTWQDNGEKLFGPGIIDMKGGLAVAVYAIRSLYHAGLLNTIPVTLLCNSDEETGSLYSTSLIQQEAKKSTLALVFECGGLDGAVVTGRKGKTGYKITVRGKAGHAAFAEDLKASAILELARKIPLLESLNNPQQNLTVNVGTIAGGIGPNTIAEYAEAEVDVRYTSTLDGKKAHQAIEKICSNSTTPGTTCHLHTVSGRPPMEQSPENLKLYQYIKQEADKLNISICHEVRSGVSDANTINACNVPVIDGLGPTGDCDHSDQEYMVASSLAERTRLTINSLLCLAQAVKKNCF